MRVSARLSADSRGRGGLPGRIAEWLVADALPGGGPGPFGFFPSAFPFLSGIAVDDATLPGPFLPPPSLYLTDGFAVDYVDVVGGPAAPTFYTAGAPYAAPAGPTHGLAFAAHGNTYGAAFSPVGGVALLCGRYS